MIALLVAIILITIVWIISKLLIKQGNSGRKTVTYAFSISLIILSAVVMLERTLLQQHEQLKNEQTVLSEEYYYAVNTNGDVSEIKGKITAHNNKCVDFYSTWQKEWWIDFIMYKFESVQNYIINIEDD